MAEKVGKPGKVNNTAGATAAKITIRDNVLQVIGADKAKVFDAFAGDGHMFRSVWKAASVYVGCDLKFYPDDRLAYVADNQRVLRMLDLAGFNVFDLDSYGSPWEQVWIIAKRRRLAAGERIGMILTEGQGLKMKMGGMSLALAKMAGVRDHMAGTSTREGQTLILNRAILRAAQMMGGTVVRRWQATGKTGSAMQYIAIVIGAEF